MVWRVTESHTRDETCKVHFFSSEREARDFVTNLVAEVWVLEQEDLDTWKTQHGTIRIESVEV